MLPATHDPLRLRYREFAEHEAAGLSPLYVELAHAVGGSEPLLRFIASLPAHKQQPNLVFAAVRHLHGTPRDARHFTELVAAHEAAIRALVLQRSTQTNEPGRCAALLPVLARLPGPLALLEVGASAGLCLLPDFYGYDFGTVKLRPPSGGAPSFPTFPCHANEATPVPDRLPDIIWRAGLDLHPIDVNDREEAAWLETLVWPGQEGRAERLRGAIEIARSHPPPVFRGDLLTDLPALAAKAPGDATLVVFHSAVLAYIGEGERERFASMMRTLDAVWISNESPETLPECASRLSDPTPPNRFLLCIDGDPVALTAPHGQSIHWLERPSRCSSRTQ